MYVETFYKIYKVFKLLALLSFSLAIVCKGEEPKLTGNTITFGALPRLEYSYQTKLPEKKWLLESFVSAANRIILMAKRDPPYDILNKALRSKAGQCKDCWHSDTNDKLLNYEIPFLIFGGLNMFLAILFPLTGAFVYCCRRQGRCWGRLIEEEMEFSPMTKRCWLSVGITCCVIIIVFGNICTAIARERLNRSLPLIRTTLQNSTRDLIGYHRNTLLELQQITGQDLEFTVSLILQEFDGILNKSITPVITRAKEKAAPLTAVLLDLPQEIKYTLDSLHNVNTTVSELINLGTSLGTEIRVLRNNLTQARVICAKNNVTQAARLCDRIPSGKSVNTVADFKKVPSVSRIILKTKDVLKMDIAGKTVQAKELFEALPDTIYNETEEERKEFTNFIWKLKHLSEQLQSTFSKKINKEEPILKFGERNSVKVFDSYSRLQRQFLFEFVEKDAIPFIKNVYSHFEEDSSLQQYVVISSGVLIFMVILSCVTVLLMIFGMVCGRRGTFDSELPSTRSRLSDFGSRLLMTSFYSVLGMLFSVHSLIAVTWLLGANGAVICNAAFNMDLVEHTIDEVALLKDGNFKIKMANTLRNCASGQTLWEAINLDQRVKLKNLTLKRKTIPHFDEIFVPMSEAIKGAKILTSKIRESLNNFSSSGIQNVQPAKFTQQTELPLISVNLNEFSDNISRVGEESQKLKNTNLTKKLTVIVNRLLSVNDDIVQTERSLSNILIEKVTELKQRAAQAMNNINSTLKLHDELTNYLNGEGVKTAEQTMRTSLNKMEKWMNDYLKSSINKIRTRCGKCAPLSNIYRAVAGSICWFLIGSTNALWLSMLITACSSVISIILCAYLAHLYGRTQENWRGKVTPVSPKVSTFLDRTPPSTLDSQPDWFGRPNLKGKRTPVFDDVFPGGKFISDDPPVKVVLPPLQHTSPSLKIPP